MIYNPSLLLSFSLKSCGAKVKGAGLSRLLSSRCSLSEPFKIISHLFFARIPFIVVVVITTVFLRILLLFLLLLSISILFMPFSLFIVLLVKKKSLHLCLFLLSSSFISKFYLNLLWAMYEVSRPLNSTTTSFPSLVCVSRHDIHFSCSLSLTGSPTPCPVSLELLFDSRTKEEKNT